MNGWLNGLQMDRWVKAEGGGWWIDYGGMGAGNIHGING